MSELRLESYVMPSASLGQESPLPPLDICLPYTLQDDYGREKSIQKFETVVLENDILRATFLLKFGGRLWSLFHKKEQRELLYVNPVFQPANLAIRNAWFSGGVEWNIGIVGHSVFTCSPVFASRLRMNDGTPVLRLYEWERIRMVPFQIDAFLPDGSDFLFIRVRITNPNEHGIPMYWWSNIAVQETSEVRVIVPAESAYKHGYAGGKIMTTIPVSDKVDLSYPVNFNNSADNFYCINPESQPWIAALNKDGKGLIQTSTGRLRGRKLFVWGMHHGGRHWQEFLSVKDSPYIELQAGLTQIQGEYLQMPAGADWSWLEAYGLMKSSPEVTHGKNWRLAYSSVDTALKNLMPQDKMESILIETAEMADKRPDEILQQGSGWGALERLRRERDGEKPFCSDYLIFDDTTLKEEQQPWLALLRDGFVPYIPPKEKIRGWMIQYQWRMILEESVKQKKGGNWLAWLHLGVMYYSCGNFEKARRAWEKSLECEQSPWAYRNLAVLAQREKLKEKAADLFTRATALITNVYNLDVECCTALIDAGRYEQLFRFIDGLPPEIRSRGRIKVIEAQAALKRGDLKQVERILESRPYVADIREGEVTLSHLWFEMHEKRISEEEKIPIGEELRKRIRKEFPPPIWLDFRQAT
jgi:tetratricopeptide (TPR) repeat protein